MAIVALQYVQQGLWLNLLFLSFAILLSIPFGRLKLVGTLWSIYDKTCWWLTVHFSILLYNSNWLKFPGDKFGVSEPNRKWQGAMASKSSMLSLVGVSELWLITDSTSHRKVVNESSVNARSRVITLNARFTDLTKDSQTPESWISVLCFVYS